MLIDNNIDSLTIQWNSVDVSSIPFGGKRREKFISDEDLRQMVTKESSNSEES